MDREDLYALKINCNGERTVGKANKGINIEKIIGLKKLKLKTKRGRGGGTGKKKRKKKKKGKLHRTAKAQHRDRGL